MVAQTEIPIAANVLGTIGTVFWCVQLLPQIWMNWRTKDTNGLPGIMMFLWALCGVPQGAYAVIENFNLPLQVQPQCFMAFCLVSWTQTLIYSCKWATWNAVLTGLGVGVLFAGAETAMVMLLRPMSEAGNELPSHVVGIVASVLLAAGLLPPYREIWKRRGRVVGINFIFLSMDWAGAFFSLMALIAQDTFDVLGGVLYSVCCLLEIGIFTSHVIWLLRTRKIRKDAAARGKTFDDVAAEHAWQGVPFKFAERKCGKAAAQVLDVEKGESKSVMTITRATSSASDKSDSKILEASSCGSDDRVELYLSRAACRGGIAEVTDKQ